MISISWSTIDSWHKCPLRIRYEIEGQPHSTSWALSYAEAGHYALKAWANDTDYMDAFIHRCSEYEHRTVDIKNWDGTFTDTETGIVQKAQIKDLLQKYIAANPTPPDPSMVEMFLTRDLGDDILLTGRVDVLGTPIVDYKLTSSPKYLSKIQAIIYSILNGGPSEFEYHMMIKARNPYYDVMPIPETQKQENLDRVTEYVIKPIARKIQLAIENPELWEAHPHEFLCQRRYCNYWNICDAHFV